MGVQKRAEGRYEVYVYDPALKRKRYVPPAHKKRGDAVKAFEDAKRTLRGKPATEEMTVREYSVRWLEFKHGPGTRRPSNGTLRHNRQMLHAFLEVFGDRALSNIPRNEALDWSLKHRSAAKVVSAMFNDAVNDTLAVVNPFANRQHKQMRGRKDITPMTEAEVDTLAGIALGMWGEYGKTCKAWILWSAWVGTRPGETFGLSWDDLDLRQGLVTVTRIKPPYNTDTVPVAQRALDALFETRGRTGLLFPSITGKHVSKGLSRWYWDPVRKAFETHIPPERREALREGQKDIALYSLRHFAASQIVARGGNEYDVSALLGNTPEVARETYIHEYKTERRDRLRGLLDGGQIMSLESVRQRKLGDSK